MRINLRDINIYYINLPEHKERNESFLLRMSGAGFDSSKIQRIEGIRKEGIPQDSVFVGCFSSQLKALKIASSEQFPFLILEDDVAINEIPEFLDIPDEADSVYVGISSWGFVPSIDGNLSSLGSLITDRVNSDLVRVFNMLSSHAILYLTPSHVESLIGDLETNLCGIQQKANNNDIKLKYYGGNLLPCDVIMANRQFVSNVFATRNPVFYQDDKHKYCTLFKI